MNELSKLYQLVLNRELDIPKGHILDIKKIDHKLLAFMQCVYNTGELGHVYTFWDKDTQVDQNALLDTYIEGMRLLMSTAYDLQIDTIALIKGTAADRKGNITFDDMLEGL